ncbi:MAG: reverse transcriptase family protein [Thermodesulfovibrionales bacterium]|nr:reverse transcriptase family protein [Thermodesulfovibrionales bacterium]
MEIELIKSHIQIRNDFSCLFSRKDIADLLEIEKNKLNYHLYVLSPSKKYSTFMIKKKGGGKREITAPISPIKILQRKLSKALELIFTPKNCIHGFIRGRNILSNARAHQKKRFVLNLDLKDFSPSIHFGRVRGLFMGIPYNLNKDVSTILAQICCHDGKLPQGAPTSPIISNMICAKLDSNLKKLAKENQCVYTRYADDITFSTNRSKFPSPIAYLTESGETEIGNELSKLIEINGFEINPFKNRLQFKYQRQSVTGLTVNRYANINRKYLKKLRAILFAWKKYGIESTSTNYFNKFPDRDYSDKETNIDLFKQIMKGKIDFIGMVKGKSSKTYIDLQSKFYSLAPELKKMKKFIYSKTIPVIYTEGKTDKKHINAALESFKSKGFYQDLSLEFPKKDVTLGDSRLLERMRGEQERPIDNNRPHIFIFDRDNKKILDELNQNDDYCERANKVFTMILPLPPHRENVSEICIEFYYSDMDIMTCDEKGRRLFLSNEFDPFSGKHYSEKISCTSINKLKGSLKIISEKVFDIKGNSIALSKNDFADNIKNRKKNFDKVDFSGFEPLFGKIAEIISIFDSESIILSFPLKKQIVAGTQG